MRPFHGVSAFPLTPTAADGRVDTEALCRLVERACMAGVASIGLLGSTGIYAYLTRDERRRAVEAAAACLGGRTPLMVGIGALRTDDAMALARDAERAGADALLLAPLSDTPLSQDEVHMHCVAVANATGLPICLYNNPTTTHFTFSRSLLARLATVETIRAVKMPLPTDSDFGREIAALRTTSLAIGYSGDWGATAALLAGADAWYSVVAGLLPRMALTLAGLVQTGSTTEATTMNEGLEPLWRSLRRFGSLRVMYVLYEVLGFGVARPPLPIQPLTGLDRQSVLAAFDAIRSLDEGRS